MGILTQALGQFAEQPAPDAAGDRTVPEEFGAGLRSGLYSAGGQLNALAAGVGGELGADEFAAARLAKAREMAKEANLNAPRVTSYKDVHSLRDALDYGAGLGGQAVPGVGASVGAGLLTRSPGAAVAAGTAAMAPLEIGDVLERQDAAGQPLNLRDATIAGTASAALQNIVPGVARAKLAGTFEKAAAGGAAKALTKNVLAVPEQAALAAGGETAKQLGAHTGVNPEQIGEAAIAGGVTGLPFAAAGAVGDAIHGRQGAPAPVVEPMAPVAPEKSPTAPAAEPPAARFRSLFDDGRAAVTDKVGALSDAISQKYAAGKEAVQGKPSEDYSGVRQVITDVVAPILKDTNPDVLADPARMGALADSLRKVLEVSAKDGQLPPKAVDHLQDVFGDDTRTVLQELHGAVGDQRGAENFFKTLNTIADNDRTRRAESEVVHANLLDPKASTADINNATYWIRHFVSGDATKGMGREEAAYLTNQFHDELAAKFGPKADVVLAAFQKKAKPDLALDHEDAQALTEHKVEDLQAAPVFYKGKDDAFLPSPDAHRAQYNNEGQAERLMKKASTENPGAAVRFMPAREYAKLHGMSDEALHLATNGRPDDHGVVVAEQAKSETGLTHNEVQAMKLDTSKTSHLTSKSRIDTAAGPMDAMRITREMDKKLPYALSDDTSRTHRLGRAFMEGVAALQAHTGKAFEVRPDTEIAKGVTFADVKKLKFSTESRTGEEAKTRTIDQVKKDIAEVKAMLKESKVPRERAQLIEQGRKLEAEYARLNVTDPDTLAKQGKYEVDPEAQVHEAVAAHGEGAARKNTISDKGELLTRPVYGKDGSITQPARLTELGRAAIDSKLKTLERGNAAQKTLAGKARALVENYDRLSPAEQKTVNRMTALHVKGAAQGEGFEVGKIPLSDLAGAISAAYERHGGFAAKGADTSKLDAMLAKEDYSSLKTKAEVDKFLADARERYKELKAEDRRVLNDDDHPTGKLPADQQVVLDRLEGLFGKNSQADLESFYDGVSDAAPEVAAPASPKSVKEKKAALLERARSGDAELVKTLYASSDAHGLQRAAEFLAKHGDDENVAKTIDVINERLGKLVQNPDTAYSLQKAHQSVSSTSSVRADVEAHINKVLGPSVKVAWEKLTHAGDFSRTKAGDLIRLSVHALDPMSTAFHESLHGFFAKLGDAGAHDVMDVLTRAAEAAPVLNQLRRLLANEPEALKQLSSPEERAAYMYQFWADGKLKVGDGAQGVLGKIAGFVRNLLGLWSNDERALHIMEHFQAGDFAKDPSAFARSVMEQGRNETLTRLKAMTEPIARVSDAIMVAGGQRLRDTGVPALRELADAMKAQSHGAKDDVGFLPAARAERTRVMNDLGSKLAAYSKAQINEALEALQAGQPAASPEARLAQRTVRNVLDQMHAYMTEAGVKLGDLGVGKDYFPRVWDASYISSHQKEFLDMVEKYAKAGQYKGDPRELLRKLMVTDGNEFTVETLKPGMQHAKERVLSFIDPADAAPFVKKNLFETMNSYVTQATRRAEWARRFGDDGQRIKNLLDDARQQGAAPKDIETAENFVRSIDGTLGDDINPTARRLMGNMIVYQNLRLLPLAIFSSVVDPAGIVVRGGTVKDAWTTFKRGVSEIPKNFKQGASKDAATELAETLGVIDNAMLVHTLGALYSQGMVGDTARKVNDTFFRYNLMEQFNTSMRVGATEAALKFIAKHADGSADAHSVRWLAELGLKPGDVQLDAQGRPKLFQADGLSPEQELQMRLAVNKWVDGAVLRPDAADKPIWMNDPHFALIAHLKQFVFSFHETILKRVMHELNHGNYRPAMALASYVPIMVASDFLKGFIQGGGSQPDWKDKWGPEDYIWSGVQRGGLLGTGQFAADVLGDIHRGGTGIGALAGPMLEQFGDAASVLAGHEQFKGFALKSMPANALYASLAGGQATDPNFAD